MDRWIFDIAVDIVYISEHLSLSIIPANIFPPLITALLYCSGVTEMALFSWKEKRSERDIKEYTRFQWKT